MEYNEAVETLRHCHSSENCEGCRLYIDDNLCSDVDNTLTYGAIFEHYDKYKWHNLRKDPEDLPLDFTKVLVCFRLSPKMNIYEVCLYKNGYFCMSFGTRTSENRNVLGWREIEPFPFEEE